jgi:hypothetical protein
VFIGLIGEFMPISKLPHRLATISIGALMMLACAVHAQSSIVGFVKTVNGDAWITTSGQRTRATSGAAIQIGSKLKTGSTASMGVSFKDNTIMSFGPDTELTIDEYLYAPAQGQLKLGTSLTRGSLNYVSGVIAKLKPDAVTVKTPTGIKKTHCVSTAGFLS